MIRALALLALTATGAEAFSPAALSRCLDQGGATQCIGLGVSSCQSDDPATNKACFAAALGWWHARRETTLAALTSRGPADLAADLKTLNTNWQAYAASMCDDISARYTDLPEACHLQQTANFALTLEAILARPQ